jgi:hypothetical protein
LFFFLLFVLVVGLDELEELLPSYMALRAMDSSIVMANDDDNDAATAAANQSETAANDARAVAAASEAERRRKENHQRRLSRLKGFVSSSLQQQSPALARHTKHHNPYDPALLWTSIGRRRR